MSRAILALFLVGLSPLSAFAQDVKALDVISIYRDLNAICRDPSDGNVHKILTCNAREKVARLLNALGYCLGHQNEDAADMHWHKCKAHEIF